MRGVVRVFVVAVSAVTLILAGAIGASAGSGHFGTDNSIKPLVSLFSSGVGNAKKIAATTSKAKGDDNGKGDHKKKCDDDDHENGTPGHENHPCHDDGGDGGDHGGQHGHGGGGD